MIINQDSDEKYHKMFKAEFDAKSGRYTLSFEVKTKRGSDTVYLVPDNGKKRIGWKKNAVPAFILYSDSLNSDQETTSPDPVQ